MIFQEVSIVLTSATRSDEPDFVLFSGNVSAPGGYADDPFHLPGSLSAVSPLSRIHSPAPYPPASPAPSADAHSPYPHQLEAHSSGGTSPAVAYSPHGNNVVSASPQTDAQPKYQMEDGSPRASAPAGRLRGRQSFPTKGRITTTLNVEIQSPPQGHTPGGVYMSAGIYGQRNAFPSPVTTTTKRGDTPETRFKRNRGHSVGSSSHQTHSRGPSGNIHDIACMKKGRIAATSVGNSRATSPYARPQDLTSRSEMSM